MKFAITYFLFLCLFAFPVALAGYNDTCPIPKLPAFYVDEIEYHQDYFVCIRGSIEKDLFTNLDITVFDGHDGVFHHWMKKLDRTKKYTLVHIDSHNDMDYLKRLNMSMFNDPNTDWSKQELHIGNFILPFIYAGMIEKVIWVKPHWEHIRPVKDEFLVGNLKNSNKMACNSNMYWMESDAKTQIENGQRVKLEVIKIDRFDLPGLDIQNDNVLLDIDVDYFSTLNPLEKLVQKVYNISEQDVFRLAMAFDVNQYCWYRTKHFPKDLLKGIKSMNTNDKFSRKLSYYHTLFEVLMVQFFPRRGAPIIADKDWLEMMNFIVHLWCNEDVDIEKILVDIKHLIEKSHTIDKKEYEMKNFPDLSLPGPMQMLDSVVNLPNYIADNREIREMKEDLKLWLKINGLDKQGANKPIITIAKSQSDGHSPTHMVHHILYNVIYDMLYQLYL